MALVRSKCSFVPKYTSHSSQQTNCKVFKVVPSTVLPKFIRTVQGPIFIPAFSDFSDSFSVC